MCLGGAEGEVEVEVEVHYGALWFLTGDGVKNEPTAQNLTGINGRGMCVWGGGQGWSLMGPRKYKLEGPQRLEASNNFEKLAQFGAPLVVVEAMMIISTF